MVLIFDGYKSQQLTRTFKVLVTFWYLHSYICNSMITGLKYSLEHFDRVGWSIYGNGRDHHDFKVTELISKTSSVSLWLGGTRLEWIFCRDRQNLMLNSGDIVCWDQPSGPGCHILSYVSVYILVLLLSANLSWCNLCWTFVNSGTLCYAESELFSIYGVKNIFSRHITIK